MRNVRPLVATFLLGVAACASDLLAPSPVAGNYVVYTIDGREVPYLVTRDTTCETINNGGYLTLRADSRYEFVLTPEDVICNGVHAGRAGSRQRGQYTVRDTVISFAPDAGYGPAFVAQYDQFGSREGTGPQLYVTLDVRYRLVTAFPNGSLP